MVRDQSDRHALRHLTVISTERVNWTCTCDATGASTSSGRHEDSSSLEQKARSNHRQHAARARRRENPPGEEDEL